MSTIKSINPYNNELLHEFEEHTEEQLKETLANADKAFKIWKQTTFAERSNLLRECANLLLSNKDSLAKIITLEMGKPISQSISEIEKCASACEFYADKAESFLSDEIMESDATKSLISYEPLGCILAVMPWNFPFWQVFRFAAPALMAGNVGILKHASNVPQCSLAIEKIFIDAGFPPNVFQSVLIGSSKVNYLIDHPIVKATTLTGSEKAGAEVAMRSGKNIKKTVLELGGSDCFIVLNDADIEQAADVAVKSRMINTGQSCIAAKRFIIQKESYDIFLEKMKQKMEALKIGDPLDEETEIGPMAREDLVAGLQEQVSKTVEKGATIFWGGGRPDRQGAFMNPSILVNVKPGMDAYEQELFGPVAIVFKAEDEEDAIRIANDSVYGLGGAIWTKDTSKGLALSRKIEAGAVFVNGMVKSDPRLPFGGIKNSGYGRELSYVGIREFVNIKSIWIR